MNARRKDIEDFFFWMRSQKYSSNTINDTIAVLKRLYKWLRAKPEKYEEWKSSHVYPPEVMCLKAFCDDPSVRRAFPFKVCSRFEIHVFFYGVGYFNALWKNA